MPKQQTASSGRASKVEAFLLVKMMEECAEVIQACSKILEHGFVATNAESGITYDNQLELAKELGDVLAVMHVLCESIRVRVRVEALNHRNIEAFAELKRPVLRVLASKQKER